MKTADHLNHHDKEYFMNQGTRTVINPVKDIAQAKSLFSKLLGMEPYAEGAHYVGFKVGDQEIGLDPNGHKQGVTSYGDCNPATRVAIYCQGGET